MRGRLYIPFTAFSLLPIICFATKAAIFAAGVLVLPPGEESDGKNAGETSVFYLFTAKMAKKEIVYSWLVLFIHERD